jgi:hypothetical protein
MRPQGPSNARRAAATARSASAWSASASSAMTSPVDGLTLAKVLPDAAAAHWPPMSSFFGFFGPPSRKGSGRDSNTVMTGLLVSASKGTLTHFICGSAAVAL